MQLLILSFLTSVIATLLMIRYAHLHEVSADHDINGVQKFHAHSVPRVGGVGIALALMLSVLFVQFWRDVNVNSYWLLLFCALPVFFGGLVEDLTKKVPASIRLILAMVGAVLAFTMINAGVYSVGVTFIDMILSWWPMAMLFTVVAVAGITNAINIIDGFNGLASAVSMMILLAIAYVALKVGDAFVLNMSVALIGGVLGLFLFNWPRGLIFLGDGGAYLIGFLIAELSILLVARNSQVSPWFPLLLVIYPMFETLFSIYRRKFISGTSSTMPDAAHLHTLIFRRIVRWVAGAEEAQSLIKKNSMTSPYLWGLSSISIIPALLFWHSTSALIICSVVFCVGYVWLYWRIVRFQTPKFLRKK